jgi:hypothetical protein
MSKTNPKHYQFENGIQVIDLTSQLDFCSGNVVKYVARAGKKEGESALDDLRKAKYYLERLIDDATITREDDSTTVCLQPAGNCFIIDEYLRTQTS